MSRSSFEVRLGADGTAQVLLDGNEVEGVVAVRVEGVRDTTPLVTVQTTAEVHVEGVGVIGGGGAEDLAAYLDQVLSDIDFETLENEILRGATLAGGGPGTTGSVVGDVVEALRRYVRGD